MDVMNQSTNEDMTSRENATEERGEAVLSSDAAIQPKTAEAESGGMEEPAVEDVSPREPEGSGGGPVIRAKYNKQEMTFTAEEAVPLVQMGLKFRAIEPSVRKLRQLAAAEGLGLTALIDRLARENEEAIYRKTLDECGGNEDAAQRLFAYQQQERERTFSEKAAEEEAFQELCEAFPGRFREPGDLPREAAELAARRGISLLDAYLRVEHDGAEKAAKERERQEKAALASSGSMAGESARPDPDAEAFSAAFSAALH